MRRAVPADAPAMARVQLDAALAGFAPIFPPDAPVPTVEALTEQWETLITEGDSEPRSRAFAACRSVLTSAEAEEMADMAEVIGTAVGQPDPAQPRRGHLRSLYVAPAWWGQGVGRRLHDAVVAHLRDRGFDRASLWVMEKNRAREMYERLGWRLSTDRQTIWPGVDEVRYFLDLG